MRRSAEWIEFAGVRSESLGVRVLGLPDVARAAARGKGVVVPGRSGALFLDDGYEDVRLTATMLLPASKQTEVSNWLRGGGDLVLSSRPGFAHRARAIREIVYQKHMPGYCLCQAVFEASPFAYVHPRAARDLGAGAFIENPYNLPAEPLITIHASGDVALMTGSKILAIQGITSSITLDCENGIAYAGDQLQTGKLSGDWPVIPPGGAMLSFSGNVAKLTLTPNWRTL